MRSPPSVLLSLRVALLLLPTILSTGSVYPLFSLSRPCFRVFPLSFTPPLFISVRSGTSYTQPLKNRQRIAISLSRLVRLPFFWKQRGLRTDLCTLSNFLSFFLPLATFQFSLFHYFYLSLRRHYRQQATQIIKYSHTYIIYRIILTYIWTFFEWHSGISHIFRLI